MRDFLGRTVLKSKLSGQDVPAQPRAVRGGHAPGAVLRPRRAGDPDHRPRPRHVLARPRRRDGRRAGRLRLGRQPLRRQPPLRARARDSAATCPTGMRTEIHRFDISDPTKTVYRATRRRCPASSSTTTRSPSTTATCAWPRPRSRRGSPDAERESQSTVTVLDQDGATGSCGSARSPGSARASGSTPCASWASSGYVVTFRQIDPLYTLDLSRPDGAEGRRRAEDPRLLRVPAPGRRGPAARRSGARAATSRRRCSTSPTWPRRSGVAQLHVRPGLDAGRDRAARVPVLGAGEPGRDAAADLRRARATFTGAAGVRIAPERADRGRPDRRTTAPSAAQTRRSSARS